VPLQAVLRLPFPDVAAVSAFVARQLASGDCHLSAAELARNLSRPGLLLCHASHPLAPHIARCGAGALAEPAGAGGEGSSAGAPEAEAPGAESEAGEDHAAASDASQDSGKAADSSSSEPQTADSSSDATTSGIDSSSVPDRHAAASILPLLLPPPLDLARDEGGLLNGQAGGERVPALAWALLPEAVEGVVAAALDISGQPTPPFASGMLPGAACTAMVHICICWPRLACFVPGYVRQAKVPWSMIQLHAQLLNSPFPAAHSYRGCSLHGTLSFTGEQSNVNGACLPGLQ
jgi:hypothetical protein